MAHRSRNALAVLLCAVAPLLIGCQTVYSPARDKQGQEAQKAWSEVDLAAQVAVPRKNIRALLDEQLVMEDEIWVAFRTARARSMAYSWKLARLEEEIDSRLVTLAGNMPAAERKKNRDELARATAAIQTIAENNSFAGQPPPDCTALQTDDGLDKARSAAELLPELAKVTVSENLERAAKECRIVEGIRTAGGAIGVAAASLEADKAAIAAEEASAERLKRAYAAARRTYDESARTLLGNSSDPKASEAVERAVAKLGSLVDAVKAAQDSFSTKFITEERLASLDGFLATYKDIVAGKGVEDGNKVAIALAVFPDLRDKARAALRDLEKPNLVPLAVQKNVELAKLEGAQRSIDLRRQVVAERQAQVAALEAQVVALDEAKGSFKDPAIKGASTKSLLEVMNEKNNEGLNARIKLWRSTTRFLDAEGRLRAEAGKVPYRISALEHERVLTLAESNVHQWQALIDPTVELMAGYGAAGLKSSDHIALFNSLTLLWNAIGVN
jgi:hypothetical protein